VADILPQDINNSAGKVFDVKRFMKKYYQRKLNLYILDLLSGLRAAFLFPHHSSGLRGIMLGTNKRGVSRF
ncbi:MAG: hypothetical protein V1792_09005, partial [Pseudomonadota bacterium]